MTNCSWHTNICNSYVYVRVSDLLFFMLGQRMGGCLTVPWCSSRQKAQVSNIEQKLLKINVLFNNINIGDYHDEMTSARFEEWWNE